MISKELFCEVMGIDINRLVEFDYRENMASGTGIYYFVDNELLDDDNEFINIYELAHRCKEWAYEKHETVINVFQKTSYNKYTAKIDWRKLFQSDSETEAIFKACEWILKQKSENE